MIKNIFFFCLYEDDALIFGKCLTHLNESHIEGYQFKKLTAHRYLWEKGEHDVLLEKYFSTLIFPNLDRDVAEIESKYGLFGLEQFYRADPLMEGVKERKAVETVVMYFKAFEAMFDEMKPDLFFMFDGGELPKRILHKVCAKYDVKVFYEFYMLFPEKTIWSDNEEGTIFGFKLLKNAEIADDKSSEISEFIERIRQSQKTYAVVAPFQFQKKNFVRLKSRTYAWFLDSTRNYRFRVLFYIYRGLKRIIRSKIERVFYSKAAFDSEKFVFFPLHNSDDSQITCRAAHLDQAYLIQQISLALPYSYKVYVKEHPGFIGGYKLSVLRQISKLPKVRLVNPFLHPHELIKRCAAVVTINSTTALEAFAFNRPVVSLGPSYYRGLGLTYDVDNIAKLSEVLFKAINGPKLYSSKDVLAFFASIEACSIPTSSRFISLDYSNENIQKYCKALKKIIQENFGAVSS